jgi:hypothetical protein
MKKMPGTKPIPHTGLASFFGHTFTADEHGEQQIQYQFRIIRPMPPERWVVQLYSFMDGTPNRLAVYTETYLLGEQVALYPDAKTWNAGYDKHEHKRRLRKELRRQMSTETTLQNHVTVAGTKNAQP